jgi:hypothetical protein
LTRCPSDAIMRAGMPVSGRWPRGMPSCEKLLGGSGLRGRGRWATPVAGPLASDEKSVATTGIRRQLRKPYEQKMCGAFSVARAGFRPRND